MRERNLDKRRAEKILAAFERLNKLLAEHPPGEAMVASGCSASSASRRRFDRRLTESNASSGSASATSARHTSAPDTWRAMRRSRSRRSAARRQRVNTTCKRWARLLSESSESQRVRDGSID